MPKIFEDLYVHCKTFVVQHWGCEPQEVVRMIRGAPLWVDQELDGAYFQDVRLGKRLRTLLGLMSNGLGQTLPLACQDWANTKAAYRFFSNPRISEEEILSGHFASTHARAAGM